MAYDCGMEPSEIDAIIDSTIGGAIPRSLAAMNFRRQLLEAIATLRNAMTETPVGAYFGIFPQNVHESLAVVRQTFELVAPVASAAPDAKVHDLGNTCAVFVAALSAATANPQSPHEMQALLVSAAEVREKFRMSR